MNKAHNVFITTTLYFLDPIRFGLYGNVQGYYFEYHTEIINSLHFL